MLKFKIHCGWQNITERIRLSVFWMIYGALKGSYQMETSKRRYTAPDALKIRTVWTNLVTTMRELWEVFALCWFSFTLPMGELYSQIAQIFQSVPWAWLSRMFWKGFKFNVSDKGLPAWGYQVIEVTLEAGLNMNQSYIWLPCTAGVGIALSTSFSNNIRDSHWIHCLFIDNLTPIQYLLHLLWTYQTCWPAVKWLFV